MGRIYEDMGSGLESSLLFGPTGLNSLNKIFQTGI